MKKRNQKLNLHRETIARLEQLTETKLVRIAGGEVTSCGDPMCACPDDFGSW